MATVRNGETAREMYSVENRNHTFDFILGLSWRDWSSPPGTAGAVASCDAFHTFIDTRN